MYKEYFKELDSAIFQAHYRITQNDGGNKDTLFNLYANNGTRLIIDYIGIKYGTTAANRTTYIQAKDSDDNTLSQLVYAVSIGSTGNFTFPHSGNIQNNNSSGMQKIILAGGDSIRIFGANLADGEYYDVVSKYNEYITEFFSIFPQWIRVAPQ